MIEYTYVTRDGLEIECELDYEEADPEVGFPAAAYLYRAYVGGHNIAEVLCEATIARIEEEAVCSMRESRS